MGTNDCQGPRRTCVEDLGVTLFLSALLSFPAALWMFGALGAGDAPAVAMRATRIGYILNAVLQALGGLAIMVWADRIAGWFEADTKKLQIDVTAFQLQALAFALVGVFLLVDGLQGVAGAAYVLLTRPEYDQFDTLSFMWAREGETMIKAVVQIVAGVVLVFGRETLARGWSQMRGMSERGSEGHVDDAEAP